MNIDINSIVKTVTRKKRGLQDPQLIYPARDWAIGMMGTLGIICFAVAFCVVQYQEYTNMSLDEEVVLTMIPYRAALVEQALVKYRAMETTHLEIIANAGGVEAGEEQTSGVGRVEDDSRQEPGVDEEDVMNGRPNLSI